MARIKPERHRADRLCYFIYTMNTSRYRILFIVAACYNFTFAFISGVFPTAVFEWMLSVETPHHPWPWTYTAALVGACGFFTRTLRGGRRMATLPLA